MKVAIYCGGIAETNAYWLPEAGLLIDAPEGVCELAVREGWDVKQLWLTHGHFDHIWDAVPLKKKFGCPVAYHPADHALLTDPGIWKKYGFALEFEPVEADITLAEGELLKAGSYEFQQLHIPGHCEGSICFYEAKQKIIFGGDVLFAGGVGRWDLPGGSRERLLRGIREKLLTLPDDIQLFPGHGEATSIGDERRENPYLQ